ncbi:MAG: GGDEF domain-containing protein [Nitrosomonadales bacterium]|nr:MAG: GGDEF domain-containing protein [Nitrosomonadales bacterium]
MKLSLAHFCLIAFIVLESVNSAAIYYLHQASPSQPRQVQSAGQADAKRILAPAIIELARNMRATAARIAQHPQTVSSLKAGPERERQAQLSNIHTLYPDAHIQWALPNGNAFAPPLSQVYSRIQAGAKGDPAPAKAVSGPSSLLLIITEPVIDPQSKAILGFVVIRKSAAEIFSLFESLQLQDAYAELQQANSNGPHDVLMRLGDTHLKANAFQELTDLPGTAWRLVVWRIPASPAKPAASPPQLHLAAWLLTSIFLALGMAGLYFALRKALKNDIDTILVFFSDIRHSRLRKAYPIKLKDLEQSFGLMYRLGKLMLGKHKQVSDSASIDHLSQVNNRRSFDIKQNELFKTLTEGWTHSLLIIDIDNFKQVNDTFGHDAGDALIVQFGKALKKHLRSSDFIARLGGDEFCVIFPNTPLKKAAELAGRLRQNLPVELELTHGVMYKLQWSGGLSEYKKTDEAENMALSRADNALLEAKRSGRNQTKLAA